MHCMTLCELHLSREHDQGADALSVLISMLGGGSEGSYYLETKTNATIGAVRGQTNFSKNRLAKLCLRT